MWGEGGGVVVLTMYSDHNSSDNCFATGPPTVVRNDIEDQETLLQQLQAGYYDSVVISPGPGTPHNPADIGACSRSSAQSPPSHPY